MFLDVFLDENDGIEDCTLQLLRDSVIGVFNVEDRTLELHHVDYLSPCPNIPKCSIPFSRFEFGFTKLR